LMTSVMRLRKPNRQQLQANALLPEVSPNTTPPFVLTETQPTNDDLESKQKILENTKQRRTRLKVKPRAPMSKAAVAVVLPVRQKPK